MPDHRWRRTPVLVTLALTVSMLGGGSVAKASTQAPAGRPAGPGLCGGVIEATSEPALDPVPYLAYTFNLQIVPWDKLWINGAPIQPYQALGHLDEDGVPMRKWNGQFYYVPTRLSHQGMERLDSYVRTGNDPGYIPTLQKLANKLRQIAIVEGDAWFMPMNFDFPFGRLKAPWFNAIGQGHALSFFVRMYKIFRDPNDLVAANAIFRGFETLGPRTGPWVSRVEDGSLWLEHYPKGKYLQVLNGHMHGVFGLYDYWELMRTPESRQFLEGSITTMRTQVHRFRRVGRVSRYGLVYPVYSMKYHELHIVQMRLLAVYSGDLWFDRFANRLVSDVD